MFVVFPGRAHATVLATSGEIAAARLLLHPITRAICGMGPDTGARLSGVDAEVEAFVRRTL